MSCWILCLIFLFIGGTFGLLAGGLCCAAGRASDDEYLQRMARKLAYARRCSRAWKRAAKKWRAIGLGRPFGVLSCGHSSENLVTRADGSWFCWRCELEAKRTEPFQTVEHFFQRGE